MTECDRCKRAIRFLPSERDKLTEYTVRNGIREEEHHTRVSICMSCVIWERLILWAIAHAVLLVNAVLAVVVILGAFAFYALSREARSQETSAIYRNPDFPCVTAIDPTVTDFACVAAIARRH
jgi:hypothetical protein